MSAISKVSEHMEETSELLGRGILVVFLAGVLVATVCVVALIAAGTFAVLHPGNDFGHGSGRGFEGDVIVQPFLSF